MYYVKELSEWTGVSLRTLHHYDSIGLLPANRSDNGYRYYTDKDLDKLQIILAYKHLGFELQEIKEMFADSKDNQLTHLRRQLQLMHDENRRILTIINTLESTILAKERGISMTSQERFKGLNYDENEEYKEEAAEKYGKEVIDTATKKHQGKEQEMTDGFNELFFAFANNHSAGISPSDSKNVELAKALHQHIREYSFDFSLEIFESIGLGYVQDERFKKNIDQFGEGTAEYVSEAVTAYVNINK